MMMPITLFGQVLGELERAGWAADDIQWAEALRCPVSADDWAQEVIFVICNSGMRFLVARRIYTRCIEALAAGTEVSAAFGHKGKATAIAAVWRDRRALFAAYIAAEDKLTSLASLPWIGHTTKYHLAKNFGLDVAKPDVHLKRLADHYGLTAQALCEDLARRTGLRVATIDTLLWRASATGVLNSRTLAVSAATSFPENAGAGAPQLAAHRQEEFRVHAVCGADPAAPVILEMLHGSPAQRGQYALVSLRTLRSLQHEERR